MNRQINLLKKANAGQRRIINTIILTGIVLFFLQGCTLKSTYNAKVTELEGCKAHDAAMTDKLVQLQNTRNSERRYRRPQKRLLLLLHKYRKLEGKMTTLKDLQPSQSSQRLRL